MRCYRLSQDRFRALDGDGAREYGGRWNRPGRAVVYASSSRALAILEVLVHMDRLDAPDDLLLLTLDVPETAPTETLPPDSLPNDWRTRPTPAACQAAGDGWLAGEKTLVLTVPSALVPEESNLLLNPAHPDFARVTIIAERPFSFDPRLVK